MVTLKKKLLHRLSRFFFNKVVIASNSAFFLSYCSLFVLYTMYLFLAICSSLGYKMVSVVIKYHANLGEKAQMCLGIVELCFVVPLPCIQIPLPL